MELQNYKKGVIDFYDIQRIVETHFNMLQGSLILRTKKTIIVLPRQIAQNWCWHYKFMFNWSLSEIGKNLGDVDHATILHAHKTIDNAIYSGYVYEQMKVLDHVLIINEKIYAFYTSKIQKKTMDPRIKTIRESVRSISKNEILSHAGMAQSTKSIYNGQPVMRGMFKNEQNRTGNNCGPHETNQSCRSLRYAERYIWRTIRRRKFSINV